MQWIGVLIVATWMEMELLLFAIWSMFLKIFGVKLHLVETAQILNYDD